MCARANADSIHKRHKRHGRGLEKAVSGFGEDRNGHGWLRRRVACLAHGSPLSLRFVGLAAPNRIMLRAGAAVQTPFAASGLFKPCQLPLFGRQPPPPHGSLPINRRVTCVIMRAMNKLSPTAARSKRYRERKREGVVVAPVEVEPVVLDTLADAVSNIHQKTTEGEMYGSR